VDISLRKVVKVSMTRLPDGVGRTIFIAALAGVMFAGFLLVTPRLTASTGDQTPGAVGGTTSTSTAAATTTTTAATTTTVAATTTTTSLTTSTTEPRLPVNGYDGTVELGVYFEGEADGKEFGVIEHGDTITWRLHVVNESAEKLWGVYAYLELHGPAACDDRILAPGESTDCWIETRAVVGSHQAQAWVNAWTLTRIVKDMVFTDFVVLP
jgi:hypothetical protein